MLITRSKATQAAMAAASFLVLATSSIQAQTPANFAKSSPDAQQRALAFIESTSAEISVSRGLAESSLGVDSGKTEVLTSEGRVGAGRRQFGPIAVSLSLSDPTREPSNVVMRVTGGCIDRDRVVKKYALTDIVWVSPADDPHPTMGFGHEMGSSKITFFFDATGSRCLTAVRAEPISRD